MNDEQFKELLEFLENLDSNRMLSELAAGRRELTGALDTMSFNANGDDTNGNQTKYAILKDEIEKVDALIVLCVNKFKN